VRVDPYLYFDGRCDDAIEFYRRTVAAEVIALVRFEEGGVPVSAGNESKVMHAHLRIGQSNVLLSDGQCGGRPSFQGFALALSVAKNAEAERLFATLAAGGQMQVPIGPAPFAPRFGMLTDRFGVSWTVVSEERGA
jgi:PhnB protein